MPAMPGDSATLTGDPSPVRGMFRAKMLYETRVASGTEMPVPTLSTKEQKEIFEVPNPPLIFNPASPRFSATVTLRQVTVVVPDPKMVMAPSRLW